MMAKLEVTQVRSGIGRDRVHRETLRSLGLKKIGDVAVVEDRPEIRGMVNAIPHMISVRTLSAKEES